MRNTILEILIENGMNKKVIYVDGTFVRGCLGGDKIGVTKAGKGSKIMAIVNKDSKPLAAIVTSANPHEITLLEQTLRDLPDIENPKIIVGDRAYDSDDHDAQCKKNHRIKLVAPHKKNRRKKPTQKPKELKKYYQKRWCVERFFAWTKHARRLLNRFEKRSYIFQGFLDLYAALVIIKDIF